MPERSRASVGRIVERGENRINAAGRRLFWFLRGETRSHSTRLVLACIFVGFARRIFFVVRFGCLAHSLVLLPFGCFC